MAYRAPEIVWRLRLSAPPAEVFALLSTDGGRGSFWAESTEQSGDRIRFLFPNGDRLESRVLVSEPPARFSLTYFGGSRVTFDLRPHGAGCDLRLRETGLASAELERNRAGWVSVLLALKARADHGVDLRNHDHEACWDGGYVDN